MAKKRVTASSPNELYTPQLPDPTAAASLPTVTSALAAQNTTPEDSVPPDSLPPALLNKLNRERSDMASCLATSDLRSAVTASRDYAQRKLLSMTPKALDGLDTLMDSYDPKTRLSAISKVLDSSAATRVDPLASGAISTDALPAAAVTALFEGLRPFVEALAAASREAGAASGALRAPYTIVPEESTHAL